MYFFEIWLMEKSKENINEIEYQAIAQRLKELRKAKGFSNYEHIAYALEMSRSAYWRLETGVNFELKTLIKICRLLDVTLEEFFEGIDIPKKMVN
jgi:transcriptional regulator with XRE-family HTH domain